MADANQLKAVYGFKKQRVNNEVWEPISKH